MVNSVSSIQSALSLSQLGRSRLLEATKVLSGNQPDQWIDGIVGLSQAKNEIRMSALLMRSQAEMDDSLLNILA